MLNKKIIVTVSLALSTLIHSKMCYSMYN